MICKINTVDKLHSHPTYTKEEREEIAYRISQYARNERVEYTYQDNDDVYVSTVGMTVARKAWLAAMAKEIYQPSNTRVYGIKTKAERGQQIHHRRKTPQGQKVC